MISSQLEKILRRPALALVTVLLISCQFLPTAGAQVTPQYQSGRIVVQFTADTQVAGKSGRTGLADFDARASRYKVYSIERVYPFLDNVEPTPKTRKNLLALRRTYYVYYQAEAAPDIVAGDFSGISGVVYAEPLLRNRFYTPTKTAESVDPDDPRFGDQPELHLLRLPEAWDEVKSESRTPKVVIAIIDGGGEWRHEDLRANVWINKDEIPDNGIDDDNNGQVDDIHGVNFGNKNSNDPTGTLNATGRGHGTAVAGSANAVSDNGVGIAGAAWNAELMHINASDENDDAVYGYQAILYAAANGADIINTSWGATADMAGGIEFVTQTLNTATDMGSLIVAAAGNDGSNFDVSAEYPARHPRVLSVGATEKTTKRRASFSNYGKMVNVFAPGQEILTTGVDNGYVKEEGTSFSSPLVAGVVALVKTKFPDMSPDALREHIRLSSTNMDSENPTHSGNLGRGLVNAQAAVQAQLDLPALRVKHWSWTDSDGDEMVDSGDEVRITAMFVNYLADASQVSVSLINPESYSFITMNRSGTDVASLASGDSVEVEFAFTVASNAPLNQMVRLYTQVQAGNHQDVADMFAFRVNRSLEDIHKNLSAFYTATGGDQWTNNINWDISRVPSEEELSTWHGITLENGWLTELALSDNNLTQSLPPEIGNFLHLKNLDLSQNTLSGRIPSQLGNARQLNSIDLQSNSLSGEIPSELGNLSGLQALLLNDNNLSGEIPPALGNFMQMYYFDLSNNRLSGEIPAELGNLSSVDFTFSLSENNLSGEIPAELGNLSQVRALFLDNNSLSGEIPAELGNLSRAQGLFLQNNNLSGEIPAELGNLSQLRSLLLQNNNLSGEIPAELGNLSQLETLFLENNSLSGTLPRSFLQLDSLKVLSFEGQNLCAPMDEEFQKWLKGLSRVMGPTCGTLRFTGHVPDQSYILNQTIPPLILPEAIEGSSPFTYALSPLPEGLSFDSSTRTISGTPTAITSGPESHIYEATDAAGSRVSLRFSIEVRLPVSVEQGSLPLTFEILGNYPNPFRQTTHLSFNLPWSAEMEIEVLDLLGRRVFTKQEHSDAGWERSIQIDGASLSAGIYLYRLTADSPSGNSVKTGNFVRLR